MTDQQIYEWLSGDDLGTTEPCDCLRKEHINGVCQDCNGSGFTFRTDEKGRERIAEAVDSFPEYPVEEDFWEDFESGNYRLYVWHKRVGQPWQAALESHVREYKAQCPDLLANAAAELKRLLREAGYGIELVTNPGSRLWRCLIRHPNGMADDRTARQAKSEASALIEAVKEVLPQGE